MSKHDLFYLFHQECIQGETDGHDVMVAAEEFAKTHPEILISPCDDHNHASGKIILIPHEDEKEFYGTTFYYVPQCHTDAIATGYLYPNRLGPLIDALKYHQRKAKEKPGLLAKLISDTND